jgi:hypothetical protein
LTGLVVSVIKEGCTTNAATVTVWAARPAPHELNVESAVGDGAVAAMEKRGDGAGVLFRSCAG